MQIAPGLQQIIREVKDSSSVLDAMRTSFKCEYSSEKITTYTELKKILESIQNLQKLFVESLGFIDSIVSYAKNSQALNNSDKEILSVISSLKRNLFIAKSTLTKIPKKHEKHDLVIQFDDYRRELDKFFEENIQKHLGLDSLDLLPLSEETAITKTLERKKLSNLFKNFKLFLEPNKRTNSGYLPKEHEDLMCNFAKFLATDDTTLLEFNLQTYGANPQTSKTELPYLQAFVSDLNEVFKLSPKLTLKTFYAQLISNATKFDNFIQKLSNPLLNVESMPTIKRPVELILLTLKLRAILSDPDFEFDLGDCLKSIELAKADSSRPLEELTLLLDTLIELFSKSKLGVVNQSIQEKCIAQLKFKPELGPLIQSLGNYSSVQDSFTSRNGVLDYFFDVYRPLLQRIYPENINSINYTLDDDKSGLAKEEFKGSMLEIINADEQSKKLLLIELVTKIKSKLIEINSIPLNKVKEFITVLLIALVNPAFGTKKKSLGL